MVAVDRRPPPVGLPGSAMPAVLVVDDDASIRRQLCETLVEEGYEATEATDGPGALEAYCHGAYDLVLLDLSLGGMDGLEVLERLRGRDAKVLVLSFRAEERAFVRAFELGAAEYLTKPVTPEFLLERIRSVLGVGGVLGDGAVLGQGEASGR
jgi:DNA-binding response OmpR family regulator